MNDRMHCFCFLGNFCGCTYQAPRNESESGLPLYAPWMKEYDPEKALTRVCLRLLVHLHWVRGGVCCELEVCCGCWGHMGVGAVKK